MARLRLPVIAIPEEPIVEYDAKKIKALCQEIDAALQPIAARYGLGYARNGASCYKEGLNIVEFLAFTPDHEGM